MVRVRVRVSGGARASHQVDVLGGELEGGRLEVDVAARAAPEQGVGLGIGL